MNRFIVLIVLLSFSLGKDRIIITFKNDENKVITKKKINYEIQRTKDGKVLKKGKLKSKKENKLKFDFSTNKKVKTYGSYDIVFKWVDSKGNPHENIITMKKDWFIKSKFKDGSISDQQELIGNKDRKIALRNKGRYPFHFVVPLLKKSSIIEGWVFDEKRNPISDVKVELDFELESALNTTAPKTKTNNEGYFKIEGIKNNITLKPTQRNGIILTRQNYKPNYFLFPLDKVQSRSITSIEEIILKDNSYEPVKILCDNPRVWSDECADCICPNSKEIWYNEINVCGISECPDNKILEILNGKVVCSDPIILETNFEDDQLDDFDPLNEKIISLKFIDSNGAPIKGLSFTYDNDPNDKIPPFEAELNRKGIVYIDGSIDNDDFCQQKDGAWQCDSRLSCLKSYIFDFEYFKDSNGNECFDIDEDLLDDFEDYDINNLFYLSSNFSSNKDAVERIEDVIYNDSYYTIEIEQNKISEIENSDIIALTYIFNNNSFKLKEINYLDNPYSENFVVSYSDNNIKTSFDGSLADLNLCSDEILLLEELYQDCQTSKGNLLEITKIFNNKNCSVSHLNNYLNNIYLVNYIYSDVMSMSDEDFLSMYKNPTSAINIFEYLDLIFRNMKTLVNNESSLEGIQPVNIDPYIANIYRKQVEFYYKYVELLYTLEIKLFQIEGSSGRGPRMYTILNNALVEVSKDKNDAGFEYLESYDTRIKVYEELENSLDGYKMYSDKAGNWGDYIKTAVTGTERKMKWIRALFGEDS